MPLPQVTVTPGSGQPINTLQNSGQHAMADSHPMVVASDQTPIPTTVTAQVLPTGASTEASVQALIAAVQAQRNITPFTDDSGVTYLLNVKNGTFNWTDVNGNAVSAPGTGARPSSGASITSQFVQYTAIAAATGYSVGDILYHVVTEDPLSGVLLGNWWENISTGAKLASAPIAANITLLSVLPAGASTSALQTAGNATLSALLTAIGTIADPALIDSTQTGTLIQWLKGAVQQGASTADVNIKVNNLNGVATDASLQSILTAVSNQRAETIWTDNTDAYFVRIDSNGTVTWQTPTGGTSSAPGTGARPAVGLTVDKVSWQATAGGTGYSTGNYLDHIITTDQVGTVIGDFWLNTSTSPATKITAPASGNISFVGSSGGGGGAVTAALGAFVDGAIATWGSKADAAWDGVASGPSAQAILKLMALQGQGILTNAPSVRATQAIVSVNDAVTVACDGMGTAAFYLAATAASGVVVFEYTMDGTTWLPLTVVQKGSGPGITSWTANSTAVVFQAPVENAASMRMRVTTVLSASSAAQAAASNGVGIVRVRSPAAEPLPVTQSAIAASAGLTSSRIVAAASTNAVFLKASAANLANVDLFNVAAYDVFVKFYNKASAPTVGTDTPVWTIPIKAGTGFSRTFPTGKYFGTGLAYAITKAQGDGDTTVLAAGDVTGAVDWI